MKTIAELITLSAAFLQSKEIENPRRAAEELLADALGITRLDLFLSYDRPLEEPEIQEVRERLGRLAKGEPWQYISGEVDFYKCKIKVSTDVLIPRQETEILVDIVAKELSQRDLQEKKLLDLCTGSGCIGLALKKSFPELHVTLADLSIDALKVASENAESNNLHTNILQGDFLEALGDQVFDYIVCNPPYISERSYSDLQASVKDFEPKMALTAKDEGLDFYKRFNKLGFKYLRPGGKVWFEIGFDQGEILRELFKDPVWKHVKLEKDWSGHDRFFSLEIE